MTPGRSRSPDARRLRKPAKNHCHPNSVGAQAADDDVGVDEHGPSMPHQRGSAPAPGVEGQAGFLERVRNGPLLQDAL